MKKRLGLLARLCLAACLVSMLPARAAAWGGTGHRIVARIAWEKLSGTPAHGRVKDILGGSLSNFLDAAVWPDGVRGQAPYKYADGWHFVSIPRSAVKYEPAYCAGTVKAPYDKPYARNIPNCVIGALDYARATLRDPSSTAKARREALKFIIHFIGDLHQPLHNSEDRQFRTHMNESGKRYGDRGGNNKFVCFFDECFAPQYRFPSNNNLHSTWDSGVIAHKQLLNKKETGHRLTEPQYAAALSAGAAEHLTAAESEALARGTPVEWAEEAHADAVEFAYRAEDFPLVSKANPHADGQVFKYRILGTPYYLTSIKRVDRQLLRGGARLAAFLEDVFAGQ